MIRDFEEVYYYGSIKDFLINYLEANQIFSELSDRDPLESSVDQIVEELDADDEVGAIENILDQLDDSYLVTRDSTDKIQIIKLRTISVKPLEYYMDRKNFKKLRKELGYTQKEFGTQMGFDSIRRGHTILEKEKGMVRVTPREARILRYLVAFGELD
ncbi:MAG: hypothetical protein K9N00_06025 [Candidatus Marinimicrobia bacterium]|nr:hypothetical protein [Candidatus Neomarinimicrobiota bacterium]